MNNEFQELELVELKPVELQGNGIMGNGANCPISEVDFNLYLNNLEL